MSDRIKSNLRREAVLANVLAPSKSALTKSAILCAAEQFLQDHQFRDLTVGQLMANAGYSRAAFYQYFNDLHGLMETLLDGVKGGIVEGAQPWLSGEGDPATRLQKSLTALIDVGAEQGFILKAIVDAASNDEQLEQTWNTFLDGFDGLVATRIAEDQATGVTPEFDPDTVARALNRMNASVIISSFGQRGMANKQDVLSCILRIWVSTLYPDDAEQIPAMAKRSEHGASMGNTKKSSK